MLGTHAVCAVIMAEPVFTKYQSSGAYHWGKLAACGIRDYHARLWARYGWFVRQAEDAGRGVIADVGCGDAALAHVLATRTGRSVFGVEPEEKGVKTARQQLETVGSKVRVERGDGRQLTFSDGSIETVVLCEVIEHVVDPDAVLCEAARVLSPAGKLLMSTPQRQGELTHPFHVREFTGAELAEICSMAFDNVRIYAAEPGWLTDAYRWRAGRLAINAAAMVGMNPFEIVRPARGRERWRQLYAVCTRPSL